jgi:pimeloyl-ACP methyl ester carboxylesterase
VAATRRSLVIAGRLSRPYKTKKAAAHLSHPGECAISLDSALEFAFAAEFAMRHGLACILPQAFSLGHSTLTVGNRPVGGGHFLLGGIEEIMMIGLLGTWIRGLLALGLMIGAGLFIKEWAEHLPREERRRDPVTGAEVIRPLDSFSERFNAWDAGRDRSTVFLIAGASLLFFSFFGRLISPWIWRAADRSPTIEREQRSHRLRTRNGYELHIDINGPGNAPALVLVHGLGSDRTQWQETVKDLRSRFRIYAFDLLGHGKSDHVSRAEHSLEAAARDLDDVIEFTGKEKVFLAGHSMGGMISLTWCSAHADALSRLSGLVLVHTTPQNPFETMAPVSLHSALQKPVHEPILRMTPPLAFLVRFMNALEYLNGTQHWSADLGMFKGGESRAQLERVARLQARIDPAAVARFSLAMMRYDVRNDLPTLDVPTLVVAADHDGTTIPEASDAIAKRMTNAELLILQSTRHMGFMENRIEFAEAVAQFHEEWSSRRSTRSSPLKEQTRNRIPRARAATSPRHTSGG